MQEVTNFFSFLRAHPLCSPVQVSTALLSLPALEELHVCKNNIDELGSVGKLDWVGSDVITHVVFLFSLCVCACVRVRVRVCVCDVLCVLAHTVHHTPH